MRLIYAFRVIVCTSSIETDSGGSLLSEMLHFMQLHLYAGEIVCARKMSVIELVNRLGCS